MSELKKIIERQNAQIKEQNAQIRALMTKIEELASGAGSSGTRTQVGPSAVSPAFEAPRKVPQRGPPPALNPKIVSPAVNSAEQKNIQEEMDAEEAPIANAAVVLPKAEEYTQLIQGDSLSAILAAIDKINERLGRMDDRLETLEAKHGRQVTRVATRVRTQFASLKRERAARIKDAIAKRRGRLDITTKDDKEP